MKKLGVTKYLHDMTNSNTVFHTLPSQMYYCANCSLLTYS